jgi:hypothetical protein
VDGKHRAAAAKVKSNTTADATLLMATPVHNPLTVGRRDGAFRDLRRGQLGPAQRGRCTQSPTAASPIAEGGLALNRMLTTL